MKTDKTIEVLKMIRDDADSDAKALDAKPFNGKTMGDQFGKTLAMVYALAGILIEVVEHCDAGDIEKPRITKGLLGELLKADKQ